MSTEHPSLYRLTSHHPQLWLTSSPSAFSLETGLIQPYIRIGSDINVIHSEDIWRTRPIPLPIQTPAHSLCWTMNLLSGGMKHVTDPDSILHLTMNLRQLSETAV